jgi:lactate dehydrogenase-like 2-hydroxyacid dehydrogenase
LKIVVLDGDTLGEDIDLGVLSQFGETSIYGRTSPQQVEKRIQDCEIVITNKVVLNREVLQNAKQLKLIQITATGINNVDLESAKEFDIEVKNVAGYSTESVVQHTFSTLFYLIGSLGFRNEFVKSGDWTESGLFTNMENPFWEISGKQFGIIGLGTIGQRVGEVAKAFGSEVAYYSTSGKNNSDEFKQMELQELLETSDIISIHAPLNENTKALLNKDNLHFIKDGSVLMNMGRGGIIDEDDLADEVKKRNILVGLDVISTEPISYENPLNKVIENENIFITPHIAWASIEARQRLLNTVIRNIQSFQSN